MLSLKQNDLEKEESCLRTKVTMIYIFLFQWRTIRKRQVLNIFVYNNRHLNSKDEHEHFTIRKFSASSNAQSVYRLKLIKHFEGLWVSAVNTQLIASTSKQIREKWKCYVKSWLLVLSTYTHNNKNLPLNNFCCCFVSTYQQ